jgi:hypothetical protein
MEDSASLGALSNRLSREPSISDYLDNHINNYIRLCVKEHLHISFPVYLDTPSLQRDRYIYVLEEVLAAKEAEMEELEKTKNEIEGLGNEQR